MHYHEERIWSWVEPHEDQPTYGNIRNSVKSLIVKVILVGGFRFFPIINGIILPIDLDIFKDG